MKKKQSYYILICIIMTSLINIGFASCDNDEDESDPPGTITIDMRKKGNGSTFLYIGRIDHIYINSSDNFTSGSHVFVELSDVGSVKGLSSIKSIPQSGWADEVGVRPGHGYVIRCNGEYMRLYVEKYIYAAGSGGVIGAAVKYQCPWQP